MKTYNTGTKTGQAYSQILHSLNSNTNKCIEWMYYLNLNGYARATIGGETQLVTRYVLTEKCGQPVGKEKYALHSCNNRKCINWKHLRWGTFQDNMNDMVKSGDSKRGETNPQAKLKESEVLKIYEDKRSLGDVALQYQVSKATVAAIKNGKRWGWLTRGS